MLTGDESVKAAIGFVQGVTHEIVADHPAWLTLPFEINWNEIHPSGLVDTKVVLPTLPHNLSLFVPGAPTVFPYQTSK